MKMAKETWIQGHCQEVEACLRKNNSMKAYRLINDLTTRNRVNLQSYTTSWGSVSQRSEILNRWTEYCSDLYNYETDGDPTVLDCPQIPDKKYHPILRKEMKAAVKALKIGKSAGVDKILGEAMIDILHSICNTIWKTGE